MKHNSIVRRAACGVAVSLAFVLIGVVPAAASTITFTATTTGCFTTDICAAGDFGSPKTIDNLKFTGATSYTDSIDTTTSTEVDPFYLGKFEILDPLANLNTGSVDEFHLNVTFTAPPNVVPGSNIYEAQLIGKITGGPNNSLTINFNNDPVSFTFSDINGSGTFTLEVLNDPMFVGQPDTPGEGQTTIDPSFVNINGKIVLTQYTPAGGGSGGDPLTATPEPASLVLLGSGLLGVAVRYRRRKS
jgi:hypothetical protein